MKTCTKCTIQIASGSWCDTCNKIYHKAYREKNRQRLKDLNKKWRKSSRDYIRNYVYSKGCTVTGKLRELCRSAKRRANKKKHNFELTVEFLSEMWNKQGGRCAITNLHLVIPQERNGGKALPFSPSIDRIDIKKGYVKDNVRLVCYVVNCGLHDYGIHVFHRIAKAYVYGEIDDIADSWPKILQLNKNQLRDKKYRSSLKGTIRTIYSQSKKNSKQRGLDFDLSPDFIARIIRPNICSITSIPFIYELLEEDGRSNPFRPSLDRIDCNKGYTKDNVRIVCVAVNYCLNEFGMEIFDRMCRSYVEHIRLSKINDK